MFTFSDPSYFSDKQLALLDKKRVPHHVVIIPDGNRRWARQQAAQIDQGHAEGANNLITIVKAAKELGIKVITFYLFSTENWVRDPSEIQALMWLLENFLTEQCQEMIDKSIRFHTIGNLAPFSLSTRTLIEETKKATAHCKEIEMIAALNYGSRDELKRAIVTIVEDCEQKKIRKEEITEELISHYLDTKLWADPELFIRTSGESRLSNFLLWQLSYSEIYIVDKLWPAFQPDDLLTAVIDYQSRKRRLGGNG